MRFLPDRVSYKTIIVYITRYNNLIGYIELTGSMDWIVHDLLFMIGIEMF